jgi:RNA polymerase sporulation-specific sigma factor
MIGPRQAKEFMANLTREEEHDLVIRTKAGDQRATTQLIRKYEPLIHKYARKYGWMAPAHSYDDLLQEGRIAIHKAALAFEPERGFRFLTLAFAYVRGGVQSRARKELKHPRFTTSFEQSDLAKRIEDPNQNFEVSMDTPAQKVREMIDNICGGLETKRAQILCDKFGLFGHIELRNFEIAEKYGLSKQAVQSYVVKFCNRARKLYPELEAYV